VNHLMAAPISLVQRPRELLLRWSDGETILNAVELRAACRCADCRSTSLQGHPHRPEAGLRLTRVSPIGSYAVQLTFSDGHDRGIYPWSFLRELSADIKLLATHTNGVCS
jgi:DUF971 family protein